MTVDEVIATWSEKEKEQFKDVIEECREREKIIADARRRSLKGIEEIEMAQRGDLADVIWAITANWSSVGRC